MNRKERRNQKKQLRMKKRPIQQIREKKQPERKEPNNKYGWIEKSPVEVHSSFYFRNPIVFFEKLSDKNGVLSKQKLTEFKEFLKLGHYQIFGGTMSGVRTLIGWNEEKSGWYYFREPMKSTIYTNHQWNGESPVISPELNSPSYCDGDGVRTWCVPPKYILNAWNIKEVA